MAKKRGLKEEYELMTRDLDWEPTYVDRDRIYPYDNLEGIKIHDWSKWADPFRVTFESYVRIQAEKERRYHAIRENFDSLQAQFNLSDARWVEALKIFLAGIAPAEYMAHRLFQYIARYIPGSAIRFAALTQAMDEMRHVQNQVLMMSGYNKYFHGLHSWNKLNRRHWLMSVPASFFDDAHSAGPFESLIAIAFGFEVIYTNILFVSFSSMASTNNDHPYTAVGFTSQSDESRHMTLGMMAIKHLLQEDPANVPIVQRWVDKWFWRAYRAFAPVPYFMDYIAPQKLISWKEAFEMYIENQVLNGLFKDLEAYGIRKPLHWEHAVAEKEIYSHQVGKLLARAHPYTFFHPVEPNDADKAWLREKYPDTFDRLYAPWWEQKEVPVLNGLPQLCQVCQLPMVFSEPGQPEVTAFRTSTYQGETYHTCSDGCKHIFDNEPHKYVQAWLPVHAILSGECGPLDKLYDYWGVDPEDHGLYNGSADERNWLRWTGAEKPETAAD